MIRTKSVYDAKERSDGERILVTRYWPRGMRRSVADRWERRVAPSAALVRAFKREGLAWPLYRRRYLGEMASAEARQGLRLIAGLARGRTVTLLCICRDERRCHRRLLPGLVSRAGRAAAVARRVRGRLLGARGLGAGGRR